MSRLSNGDVLFTWPAPSPHLVTAGWTYSDGSKHDALDLGLPIGTPIYAMEDGFVDTVQLWNGITKTGMQSYGNMIRITHSNYKGKMLQTRYAHLSKILVKKNQQVKEGDLIGYSGNSGSSTGPHLHFEVIWIGIRRNPLSWLDDDFTKKYSTVRLGNYTSIKKESIITPNKKPVIENTNKEKFFPKYIKDNTISIVNALINMGEKSNFTYRSEIAKVNNIPNYTGTPEQNLKILKLLKEGELIKP